MNKLPLILSALILITSLAGCADHNDTIVGEDSAPSQTDYEVIYTDPNDFRETGTSYSPTTELLCAERDFNAEPFVFTEADSPAVADFSLKLFNSCYNEGKNTMLSPLSVMYAFGMVTLGANGDTLTQMEEVFGLTKDKLAETLTSIHSCLVNNEYNKVSLADSIWIKNNGFTPNEQFIEENTRIYGSDIFSAPFDDGTLRDINSWVESNTFGMIKNILDEIPEDAVMYLINTLAFDCEWADKYSEYQVSPGDFNEADGETKTVDMMMSEESCYLENESCTGFIKYFRTNNYGFAALLPKEGMTVSELAKSLEAQELCDMLSSPIRDYAVYTRMPKFSYEYDIEMSEILENMGITDAFDSNKADLSGMGTADDGNVYLSRIIHKTFIEVSEGGTRAGAATVIEAVAESCAEIPEIRNVILDRPFMFVIFETNTTAPLFIGTYESVE